MYFCFCNRHCRFAGYETMLGSWTRPLQRHNKRTHEEQKKIEIKKCSTCLGCSPCMFLENRFMLFIVLGLISVQDQLLQASLVHVNVCLAVSSVFCFLCSFGSVFCFLFLVKLKRMRMRKL